MKSFNYKNIATDFLMLTSKGDSVTAFRKYSSPGFKHHNVYFKGDARTLMTAMEENAKKNPGVDRYSHNHQGQPNLKYLLYRMKNSMAFLN
jgi:hypothetical protein